MDCKILSFFCAVTLLVNLCKADSTDCTALVACAEKNGQTVSISLTVGIFEAICKKPELLQVCFQEYKQCSIYSGVLLVLNSVQEQAIKHFCGQTSGSQRLSARSPHSMLMYLVIVGVLTVIFWK